MILKNIIDGIYFISESAVNVLPDLNFMPTNFSTIFQNAWSTIKPYFSGIAYFIPMASIVPLLVAELALDGFHFLFSVFGRRKF